MHKPRKFTLDHANIRCYLIKYGMRTVFMSEVFIHLIAKLSKLAFMLLNIPRHTDTKSVTISNIERDY